MPYIKQSDRKPFDIDLPKFSTPGELNYFISRALIKYMEDKNITGYAGYNEVVGVLECCKLEFSRRIVAPYEDRKIAENGDVY